MFRNFASLLLLLALGSSAVTAEDGRKILRRGNGVEPESLDPHRTRGVETQNIMRDLYEGLTKHAADGSIAPGVARSWQVSDDGLLYTFVLRNDAKWSDGTPVTVHDFVFGLRRALQPATASPYAKVLDVIENAKAIVAGRAEPETLGVRADSAGRLLIQLDMPAAHLPQLLALPVAFPVNRDSLAKASERFSRPENSVTNGAYLLASWRVHGHLELKKNPHYWNRNGVAIDTVIYYPLNDENAELSRFRAGELDLTFTLPARRVAWARREQATALHLVPYLGTYFYGFNLTRPPFKDRPGLRRALSMVIDRQVLAEKIMNSGDVAAWSWIPPGISGYQSARLDYADWNHDKRLAAARKLYVAAGYGPENPLQLELRFNTGDNHR
ncbi:MAG: peptide ABC transporter substrate-binding protein, partial [Gammaproteobacteria bacterium]|nr:peptide ABC transporter substrate-binding protein [Gammaproteobacteria bacterium]